ncbi:MAG: hypothetical protein NVSMB12_08070 [Acidimicrobiales bacterium]
MSFGRSGEGYTVASVIKRWRPVVQRLREIVAWDEPWDYEDDDPDA